MKTNNRGQGMMSMVLAVVVTLIIGAIIYIPLDQIWKELIAPVGVSLGTNQTQVDQMNIIWDGSIYVILFGLFWVLLIRSTGK